MGKTFDLDVKCGKPRYECIVDSTDGTNLNRGKGNMKDKGVGLNKKSTV